MIKQYNMFDKTPTPAKNSHPYKLNLQNLRNAEKTGGTTSNKQFFIKSTHTIFDRPYSRAKKKSHGGSCNVEFMNLLERNGSNSNSLERTLPVQNEKDYFKTFRNNFLKTVAQQNKTHHQNIENPPEALKYKMAVRSRNDYFKKRFKSTASELKVPYPDAPKLFADTFQRAMDIMIQPKRKLNLPRASAYTQDDLKTVLSVPQNDKIGPYHIEVSSTETMKGARMGGRHYEIPKLITPGPGDYNPTHSSEVKHISFTYDKDSYLNLHSRDKRKLFFDEEYIALEKMSEDQTKNYTYFTRPIKNKHSKGYSFSKLSKEEKADLSRNLNSDLGLEVTLFEKVLGPGHYSMKDDYVSNKSPSYSFSYAHQYAPTIMKQGSLDEALRSTNHYSIMNTNFQRFSKTERFKTPQTISRVPTRTLETTPYSRLVKKQKPYYYQKEKEESPIVARNLKMEDYKIQSKIKRIRVRSMIREFKIHQVKNKGQDLFEGNLQALKEKIQKKNIKTLIKIQNENIEELKAEWIFFNVTVGVLRVVQQKFELKREMRKRSRYLCKLLCYFSWTVGKINKNLKNHKFLKSAKKIQNYVKSCSVKWFAIKKVKDSNVIVSFLENRLKIHPFQYLMEVIIKKVRIIQKFCRRVYVRRRLLFAIMNFQWSLIEAEILKIPNPSQMNQEYLRNKVLENIHEERELSNAIPLKARMKYIHKCLAASNSKYEEEFKDYKKITHLKRMRFYEDLTTENAERMLKGLKPLHRKFVPGSPPVYRLFIDKNEMIPLIIEAFTKRIQWTKRRARIDSFDHQESMQSKKENLSTLS